MGEGNGQMLQFAGLLNVRNVAPPKLLRCSILSEAQQLTELPDIPARCTWVRSVMLPKVGRGELIPCYHPAAVESKSTERIRDLDCRRIRVVAMLP